MSRYASSLSSRSPSPSPSLPDYTNGRLVIPPTHLKILAAYLSQPGMPTPEERESTISPERMMQYSALSPLELHERGAELVRVLLKRDRSLRKVGRDDPDVGDCEPEDLIEGPMIARTKRCGFHEAEDEEDLWHHAMMIGLQLHSRYPEHEDGLPAILNLSDRVPALTEAEVSRVLYRHWKSTYAWLKDQGGLHGPTVDGFRGSTTEPEKLVLNCDDVMSVVAALEETDKTGVRTMVYNAAVSEERNHWMQTGYWSDQADECVHAGMTGNLLEIEAHYPHFAEGTPLLPLLRE